jgi:hypothetical protein
MGKDRYEGLGMPFGSRNDNTRRKQIAIGHGICCKVAVNPGWKKEIQ